MCQLFFAHQHLASAWRHIQLDCMDPAQNLQTGFQRSTQRTAPRIPWPPRWLGALPQRGTPRSLHETMRHSSQDVDRVRSMPSSIQRFPKIKFYPEELSTDSVRMAKRKTKKTTADGGGRSTEGILEEEDDTAPAKGGGDEPAAKEVVVSVPVHCKGCARKLRGSLLRIEGVEEVIVDSSTNTVVVRGQKALEDPMMVAEMVERRTRKKVQLLSPSSPAKLPPSSAVKSRDTKKESARADAKSDVAELDMKMAVVLKIEMHCEACCEEMQKRILKIKGVEEAVPHMKSSHLLVKGVVEPATLVGLIHKCTGRKAAIVRAEPLDPPPAAATTIMTKPTMDNETPEDANANQQEPTDNLDEENDEGVEEETKQEDNGEEEGGDEEKNVDEKTKMEEQNNGDGVEEEKTHVHMPNGAIDGAIEEKNQTKDHQFFKLPVQAGVVAVAPETDKMDVNSLYQYYYHPAAYAYAYPHYAYRQYQYPYAGNPAAMYRPYPHYPPETLNDENPEACTIM